MIGPGTGVRVYLACSVPDTREAWVLEPKPVMDLLRKVQRVRMPLGKYSEVKPIRGVTTGFNEAFFIDVNGGVKPCHWGGAKVGRLVARLGA